MNSGGNLPTAQHVQLTGTTTPRGRFRSASSPRPAAQEHGTGTEKSSPQRAALASSSSRNKSSYTSSTSMTEQGKGLMSSQSPTSAAAAHEESGVDAEVAAHLARRAEAMANRSEYDLDDDDEDVAQNEILRRSYALAAGSVPPQQSNEYYSSKPNNSFGGGGGGNSGLMPAPLEFDGQKQGRDRQREGDGHTDSALSRDNGGNGGGYGASSSIQSTADFLARRRQRQQQAAAQGASSLDLVGGEESQGGTPFEAHAEGFNVADNDDNDGDDHNDDGDDASGSDIDIADGYGVRYADDEFAYAAKENLANPQPVSAGNKEKGRRTGAPKPASANPYGSSANPKGGARGGKKKSTAKAPGAVKFPALPKGRLSR